MSKGNGPSMVTASIRENQSDFWGEDSAISKNGFNGLGYN
jgi:hypothetical protein